MIPLRGKQRKKFYRILQMLPALQAHWDYLLTDADPPIDDVLRAKIAKIRQELPKHDIDIVVLDISKDGIQPFYRKGNQEWDEGYVRMRVRENHSPQFWLRRRWFSRPTDVITPDRATVTEKNLPVLWRKFPVLPILLTECLYNRLLELERQEMMNESMSYQYLANPMAIGNPMALPYGPWFSPMPGYWPIPMPPPMQTYYPGIYYPPQLPYAPVLPGCATLSAPQAAGQLLASPSSMQALAQIATSSSTPTKSDEAGTEQSEPTEQTEQTEHTAEQTQRAERTEQTERTEESEHTEQPVTTTAFSITGSSFVPTSVAANGYPPSKRIKIAEVESE